jgi:hypothetical protein
MRVESHTKLPRTETKFSKRATRAESCSPGVYLASASGLQIRSSEDEHVLYSAVYAEAHSGFQIWPILFSLVFSFSSPNVCTENPSALPGSTCVPGFHTLAYHMTQVLLVVWQLLVCTLIRFLRL